MIKVLEARKIWMNRLEFDGWTIHTINSNNGNALKVPYATKDGCSTVWFHPMAVYQGFDRKCSRSVTSDVRDLSSFSCLDLKRS